MANRRGHRAQPAITVLSTGKVEFGPTGARLSSLVMIGCFGDLYVVARSGPLGLMSQKRRLETACFNSQVSTG